MGRTGLSCAALTMFALVGCGRPPEDRAEALRQAAGRGNAAEVKSLIARGADLTARDATGKTVLFNALGNREVVELLLTHGADINAQDRSGFTPLHTALRSRTSDVARLLIGRGAQVHTQSHDGETPLHTASELGDTEIVRLLVRRGAEVDAATQTGDTPLLRAARQGHHDIAQHLIAEGADVDAWGITLVPGGEKFQNPLHAAIECDHRHLVQLLLDSGADVDAKDRLGRSPAVRAMQKNQKRVVAALAAAGADLTIHLAAYLGDMAAAKRLMKAGADVNLRDDLQRIPLHYAAGQGRKEVAELLIANGAEVNATDNDKRTPLHYAIEHVEVAKVLADHGAGLNTEDRLGETPLRKAVFHGDKEVVDLLIARGAAIDLHLAAYIGRRDKVKELLASGVDIDVRREQVDPSMLAELWAVYRKAPPRPSEARADTPLHRAVQGGHTDVVEFLVGAGADLTAQGNTGQTALHDAAYLGFAQVAEVLISHGADVNAVAENHQGRGQTSLQIAARCGHTATVALLIANGADVDAEDTQGNSALFYAWERGFADIVALLGGDANDPSLAERRPYTAIIRNPSAIGQILSPSEYDDVWIPAQTDIEGLDAVLKSHLTENTAIRTRTSVNREHLLANLRCYCREYIGFIYDGRSYLLCNMFITTYPETPDEERFRWESDGSPSPKRVIFDAKNRSVASIDERYLAFY
ncbi:ankyrin repeat domain-containing protein [Anaerobaca lacustris]|uniref:Ankyrin repeat domain-containing protein n=1 Tax=Anaerobaca lacustris TaxID=3044600 RepID=A0AAW6U0D5_9BACT|nr:ankyrin repeat domain-containing protein [Sedimentisphaerales bacterium M17dextr]